MTKAKNQTPQIVPMSFGELVPYARNARTHSDEQVAQLAASLREFGWTNPVLVDAEGGIIAGHGRVMAARKLAAAGVKIPNWPDAEQVPTIALGHLTKAQRRAYVLADNQLATRAGWDFEVLAVELDELRDEGVDLSLLGWEQSELNDLIGTAGLAPGLTDEDDVPPTPEEPVSELGDVWLLGRHRIVCGDCTEAHVVAKALSGVKPHLMVTDPPYGVEYDPEWRAKAGVNNNKAKMGVVLNDDKSDWRAAWALFPGDVVYCWHAGRHASSVQAGLEATGFDIRCQIIWAKDRFALSRGHYHWQHEPCWYAVRGTGHWNGDRSQSTLWQIKARDDSGIGHGTQKPVECMKRPIENNSSPGQAVYEPFSGSGTTIIAAEMTGRACHAIELSPAYVDVAVKRWQAFTGQQATLEATGDAFDEVAAQRKATEAA
jgi:DNA modification methylase